MIGSVIPLQSATVLSLLGRHMTTRRINSGSAYIFQVKTESPPPALPSPPPSQIVPDEKTITLFAGCSPLDKLTFNVENFKEQVGAMLITKSLSNDFKYDKAVQMESSDCGTFTTNTIPAQGEEFGFYLYNLNNFTEYDAVSDIGCEGTDTEKCPPGDVWTSLATCTNSVEGPGYTAHHRVFDGETFSYNWGTCDSTPLVSRIWSPCWDYRHPLIPLYSPCFQLPRLASSPWRWLQRWLSWSSQKGAPQSFQERSRHPPPKRRGTGRSTSDLLLCVVLRLFYFQIGYAENSRNVHNNLLSIRLSLLLALFFLLHPHPSLNAREEILPYYCLVKFNTSFWAHFWNSNTHIKLSS